jgi:predicted  nucleic acid-binding Zn-ribbon protein
VTPGADALHQLLAVQDLDTAISQLRHQRDHLPERAAAAAVQARVDAEHTALAEVARRRRALADAQEQLERTIRDLDARYADLAAKLPRTMVVREAEALLAEQRAVGTRRSGVEDEELALLEEDEALDTDEQRHRTELAEAEEALADAQATLEAAEAVLHGEEEELQRRRAEAVEPVPAELLARYEQLRPRFGGVAVARLVGGRCDGCHLALAQTALERIRSAPPDALVECEECGRLLVR